MLRPNLCLILYFCSYHIKINLKTCMKTVSSHINVSVEKFGLVFASVFWKGHKIWKKSSLCVWFAVFPAQILNLWAHLWIFVYSLVDSCNQNWIYVICSLKQLEVALKCKTQPQLKNKNNRSSKFERETQHLHQKYEEHFLNSMWSSSNVWTNLFNQIRFQ